MNMLNFNKLNQGDLRSDKLFNSSNISRQAFMGRQNELKVSKILKKAKNWSFILETNLIHKLYLKIVVNLN